jgi:hypothetical protein
MGVIGPVLKINRETMPFYRLRLTVRARKKPV